MARLVLGPLLRHVGERSATVWVETDRPCEVGVLGAADRTFTVHGHHFALVEVDGLDPGADVPYEVLLDGERVWPEPGAPPSRIRAKATGGTQRFPFGSCRVAPASAGSHGFDALAAYARRLRAGGEWPEALLMIGDQVYADETTAEMREFIEARRNVDEPPYTEVADFEEYAELYRLAWSENPEVRWLLSTVPTLMIFDDHDIRDDWNTSAEWRREMARTPWWHRRIVGGLGAYWVYQHLGNLTRDQRTADPGYREVRAAEGDAGEVVDELAAAADREPAGARWSYARDFGRTRVVVVDSRCGRVLEDGRRAMLDDRELAWLREQCHADVDHLIVATSLPLLLPPAIHHLEAWDEAVAAGAWGRRAARYGEKIRQGADLEHWAAFEESFGTVCRMLLDVAGGERPPAGITVISGDVHYSYLARVDGAPVPISQAVCSPMRNPLIGPYKLANQVGCTRVADLPARALARLAGVPKAPLRWRLTCGPWFHNALATVHVDGRSAHVRWEAARGEGSLAEIGRAGLT